MAVVQLTPAMLSGLSEASRRCIERLLAHQAEGANSLDIPKSRHAAVLILLYEKSGGLKVLLTTRSKTLRTHPGQTALPGGKMDETDQDAFETAYREAFEEVGLPMNHPAVHTLCALRPFFAVSKLLVTPVVAVLTDPSVLCSLTPCESEVDVIFDHPLEALLDPTLSAQERLVEIKSELWPAEEEYHNYSDNQWSWLGNSFYRMHRFRSTASAIKGLTAEILITAAEIAYDRQPSYTRYAPGQFTTFNDILRALDPKVFMELRQIQTVSTAGGIIVGRT
ncbi:hypothetical protein PHLCEN_2v1947 [Hermanssonia centrifuga]|uniref:Nudix hydrolase domain-containing protein n=1 Tax=Hermanssonia centrifuga TaxID=98765 RepID=A0A2R6RVK1_9APHY|nr:hypothetical protein PHLCEN_2v1947 [Hermanssonia centrifuga]